MSHARIILSTARDGGLQLTADEHAHDSKASVSIEYVPQDGISGDKLSREMRRLQELAEHFQARVDAAID